MFLNQFQTFIDLHLPQVHMQAHSLFTTRSYAVTYVRGAAALFLVVHKSQLSHILCYNQAKFGVTQRLKQLSIQLCSYVFLLVIG